MSIITTGAPSITSGTPPNRLEINTLIKDKVQFSLYIQALSKPPFRFQLTPN